jgi:hypothetical protein
LHPEGGTYLNFKIPSKTNTISAKITAPSRPKMSQPKRNANTEPIPMVPQFIVIAILSESLSVKTPY